MTRPDVDLDDYLAQVALATAGLVWADLRPRGVAVTVEGGGARARRALLGDDDFSLDITEDVVEPAAGGGAVGQFAETLFARATAMNVWLHWATLASNPASQRLGQLRRRHHEARITTYVWS